MARPMNEFQRRRKGKHMTWTRAEKLIEVIHAAHPELELSDIRRATKRRMGAILAKEWEGEANKAEIVAMVLDGRADRRREPLVLGPYCPLCDRHHDVVLGCPVGVDI